MHFCAEWKAQFVELPLEAEENKTKQQAELKSDLTAPWDKQLLRTAGGDRFDIICTDRAVGIILGSPVHSGLCWLMLPTFTLLNQNKPKGWKNRINNPEPAPATELNQSSQLWLAEFLAALSLLSVCKHRRSHSPALHTWAKAGEILALCLSYFY